MKNIFILCFSFFPLLLLAQQTEGTVSYTETIQLNIELPPDVPEEMKARIPKERSFPKVLFFNAQHSFYQDVEQEEEPDMDWNSGEGGGRRIRMRMMRPQNSIFKNLAEDRKVEKRDLMGKTFLIKDEIDKYSWKLTGEQSKVAGYFCQKATYADSSRSITAWFTPQIPVPTGPGSLGGLPGLILKVESESVSQGEGEGRRFREGKRTIMVDSVKLGAIDASLIREPDKGKEVTEEEFREIRREKMEEMREQFGGRPGGGRVIIRRN
jgi:GLPGLI family protein